MSLGDFWLSAAIQQGWIAPLPLSTVAGWDLLPQPWQQMVTRNADGEPDPNGQIWAAPYRYAPLAIAYRADRRDELGRAPADWDDLWNPAIQGRLTLPDSARSVIGLTLKKLERSINTDDLNDVPQLRAELDALHGQVRLYSSDAYLQPLLLADTWVAVGWLSDLLPLVRRDPRVAVVIPPAGTLLSADMWVMPTATPASTQAAEPLENSVDLVQAWIEYCWNLAIATRFSLLGDAPSPVILGAASQANGPANAALPDSVRNNPLLVPPADTLERSEFLLPLSAPSTEQYQAHWRQMRLPS
jgi:putative spermidine/putrescine transport system substrate-binding protein